jgi:murein DD-endopeptidase MepM/ murein hydrolase activator NlpD
MKYWPVKESYSKKIPKGNEPGSFWCDRSGRYHCGADIYAPLGSEVVAVEDGEVIEVGVFTSPKKVSYWNTTYYILVKMNSDLYCKYAEIEDVQVKKGDIIKAGQCIAKVAAVINKELITEDSPRYIQELIEKGHDSMLHFELYKNKPVESSGNWFGGRRPSNLLDPTGYLEELAKR